MDISRSHILSSFRSEATILNVRMKITFYGVALLVIAVVSSSTIPTFFNLWHAESSVLKNAWRPYLTFIFGGPLALYYLYTDPTQLRGIKKLKLWKLVFYSAFITVFMSWTYIRSSELTLVSHTICIGQAAGPAFVIMRLLLCTKVHRYEKIGTLFVVLGAIVLASDTSSSKLGEYKGDILMGDMLAAFSAFFFAGYFVVNDLIV